MDEERRYEAVLAQEERERIERENLAKDKVKAEIDQKRRLEE